MLDECTDGQIVTRLNGQGLRSGKGKPFTRIIITNIRNSYGLRSRYQRLRQAGMLSLTEMANRLKLCKGTVKQWRRSGLLQAHAYNDKKEYLYEPAVGRGPVRWQGIKLRDTRRFHKVATNRLKEVQDEA